MGRMGRTHDYEGEAGGHRCGPACKPRSSHAGGRAAPARETDHGATTDPRGKREAKVSSHVRPRVPWSAVEAKSMAARPQASASWQTGSNLLIGCWPQLS